MKNLLTVVLMVLFSVSASAQAPSFQDTLKLAVQGNTSAQHNIGVMYAEGLGVVQNDRLAVQWYRLAAEQGFAESQDALGWMYDNGRGVAENDQEAVRLYHLAANQGYVNAQHNLAIMYANGYGVTENHQEAVKWYRLAADQGYWPAQYNLGLMYANGYGVLVDFMFAYMWFSVSFENGGDTEVQRNRDIARDFLSTRELEQAKAMATECIEKKICDSVPTPIPASEALERASRIVNTLQELNELFESGALSEEEFQAAKRKALGLD